MDVLRADTVEELRTKPLRQSCREHKIAMKCRPIEARQNRDPEYLRTLPSDEILQSQEPLVRGFIDSGSGYVDMPMEVFGRLGAEKRRPVRTVAQLSALPSSLAKSLRRDCRWALQTGLSDQVGRCRGIGARRSTGNGES